jgi:hypothetical protein
MIMAAVNKIPSPKKWYDAPSIRRCEDGTLHEGKAELITWSYTPGSDADFGDEATGFGAVILEEAEEFKSHFEVRVEVDEYKIFICREREGTVVSGKDSC